MAFSANTEKHSNSSRNADIDVAEVLAKTDIVSIIGEVVPLAPRRGSKTEMVGMCPFHADNNPSFEVNAAKGVYSCWVCAAGMNGNRGGDAISFVRRYYGLSFKQAVEFLFARQSGRRYPGVAGQFDRKPLLLASRRKEKDGGQEMEASVPDLQALRPPLYEVMESASRAYERILTRSAAAQQYLFQERGLNPKALASYVIGCAGKGFQALASCFKDYETNPHLLNAGLVKERSSDGRRFRYDFFRDRLIFGIRDDDGRIAGFGARCMSDAPVFDRDGNPVRTPKYLNSPETAIFSKSDTLFGWFEGLRAIEDSGRVLVVEGYMDVLSLASHGINNAVACMGTTITSGHAQKIFGRVANLTFCLDADVAGQQGAFRGLQSIFPHLDDEATLSFVTLPEKMDPDSYIREYGKEAFLAKVNNPKSLEQFWQEILPTLYDTASAQGRNALWSASQRLLGLLPEESRHRDALSKISENIVQSPSIQNGKVFDEASTNPLRSQDGGGMRFAGRFSHQHGSPGRLPGNTPAIINAPYERLLVAAMKMPSVAQEISVMLSRQVNDLATQDLIEPARVWQQQFERAIETGDLGSDGKLSPREESQYRAILESAPVIFENHLADLHRQQLMQAHQQGEIDKAHYLSKMQRNRFERAC